MDIHETAMDRFHKYGIVLKDNLKWDLSEFPVVMLSGQIELRGGLILEVQKSLVVTGHSEKSKGLIQSQDYSYNLRRKNKKRSEIFRYDNWHAHTGKGHKERFHKHIYDVDGKEIEVKEYKLRDWPELSKVIDEANQFYLDNIEVSESITPKKKSSRRR